MTTLERSDPVAAQLARLERENAEFRQDVMNQMVALQTLIAGTMKELRRTNGALERTYEEVADLKKK